MFQTKVLSLAVAAGVFALSGVASAQQEQVVRIGHVGPMSGNIAHLGRDNENGAILAIEDLNSQNIVIGGNRIRFELVPEDDAADPRQATAVATKLVDANVNGVIGHLNSGTSIPASRIYHDAGIPQISPSSTNPTYTRQGFKTAFRVVTDDAGIGGTLARYAVNELKATRIAVIDDRTAYGQGIADEFIKALQAAGIQPVSRQFTNDRAVDFQAILTTIRAQNPELIFFGGMDAVGGPMLRQMVQLGMGDVKFMGGDGVCSPQLTELAGGAANVGERKVWCAKAGGVTEEFSADYNAFLQRFQTRFGQPVQIYAPYVYDAMMTMVAAMKAADSVDPAVYNDALFNVEHRGVTGLIRFDEKGDLVGGTLTLMTYEGGERKDVGIIQ